MASWVRVCLASVLLCGVCVLSGQKSAKKEERGWSLSRGWGSSITWVKSYEEGLSKMASSQKPLMIIHHRDDCPYSQALKKRFVADKKIAKMAREGFVMLNIVEETTDQNLAPDGHYVPRILFVDPSMRVRNDIAGRFHNRLFTYEPDDMELLAENMRRAQVLLHSEL